MKRNLSSSLLLLPMVLLLLAGCRKVGLESETTPCIDGKIVAFKEKWKDDGGAFIARRRVDGKTYYLFGPGCCDFFIELYDEQCNYVCAPSGGFSGAGDGNCPQWVGAIEDEIIWEN